MKKTRLGRITRVINKKTTTFTNESDSYLAVLVKTENGETKTLMMTDAEFFKALSRGEKNKEDQLQQNLISLIID